MELSHNLNTIHCPLFFIHTESVYSGRDSCTSLLDLMSDWDIFYSYKIRCVVSEQINPNILISITMSLTQKERLVQIWEQGNPIKEHIYQYHGSNKLRISVNRSQAFPQFFLFLYIFFYFRKQYGKIIVYKSISFTHLCFADNEEMLKDEI